LWNTEKLYKSNYVSPVVVPRYIAVGGTHLLKGAPPISNAVVADSKEGR
jgi:hypothetical protein